MISECSVPKDMKEKQNEDNELKLPKNATWEERIA